MHDGASKLRPNAWDQAHVYYQRNEDSGKLYLYKPNRTGLTAEGKLCTRLTLQFTEQAGLPPAGQAPAIKH